MNGTADITFSGLAVAKASPAAFVAGSHTCNNTYCHGFTEVGGTGTNPVWTDTTYLTGTPSNTGDCAKCHGFPPNTSGHSALAKPSALNVCTGCHPHVNANGTFTIGANRTKHMNGQLDGGESAGNVACDSCHSFSTAMAGDTATYHHPVASTTGGSTGTCLQCHVDHNIFSPLWNAANPSIAKRGQNLRMSILGSAPSTSDGNTNTDFGDFSVYLGGGFALGNGGVCISCHTNAQTTSTNQKNNPPAGTSLVAIDRVSYGSSSHGQYVAVSTYSDGTTFNANCSKCHLAKATETSSFQTGNQFGTHLGYDRKLLGGLGMTVVSGSDPLEENHCFRCHSKTTDTNPGGAAAKATTLRDYYNRATMDAAAEAVFSDFAKTGGRHNVAGYSGTHYLTEQNGSGLITTKHIECDDCHNPHAATATNHNAGTNNVSGVLTGVKGATPTFVASNWGGASAYTSAPAADKEYKICFKCHNGSNTGWGGTGALAWTDIGLEFNPANKSFHPVVLALNGAGSGSTVLNSAQMANGWTTGATMYCSDCHATDTTGSKGPHGSGVKWMLTGTNRAWPYTTTAGNGGSTGTLWTYNNRVSGAANGVFCFNCHPSTAPSNHVHTRDGDHQSAACVSCHIRVPHGGKVSRLINTNTAGRIPRYSPAGDGTGTIQMTQFKKAADYSSYGKTNCQAGCAGDHSGAVASPEAW
jgi:hypothetical protein